MDFTSINVPPEEARVMRKRILPIALIVFAFYFIAVYPATAAELTRDTVGGAVDLVSSAAESLSNFLEELVNGA